MKKESSTEKQDLTLQRVIDADMCIACGACIEACPEFISSSYDSYRGAFEIKISDQSNCINCTSRCLKVCPSIEIDFIKAKNAISPVETNDNVPPKRDEWVKSVKLGFSPIHKENKVSSSGGVLRAMIEDSLKSSRPVICLAIDPEDKTYKPRLLSTLSDMTYVPGSIYHSISFEGAIELIRKSEKPVMLVAIPCHLAGIAQYIAEIEPQLGSKIDITCGIICGWMYSNHSIQSIAQYKQIEGPIEQVTYRGQDRVGKLKILTKDREYLYKRDRFTSLSDLLDHRSSFSTDFNRLRCRVCEDHTNMLADVVAGDAWLKRTRTEKISILVARTGKGAELLEKLEEKHAIEYFDATYDDIIESQSHNLVYGIVARKLNEFLKLRGILSPSYLFSDANSPVKLTFSDRVSFKMELFFRDLVRSGYYKAYRRVYFLLRWKIMLKTIIKKFLGRL